VNKEKVELLLLVVIIVIEVRERWAGA